MIEKERKFRIAILTLQSVNNYGSFLQAEATRKILDDSGKFEIVFYNYYPKATRFLGLLKHWTNWNPVKVVVMLPTILRWRLVFKKYREKNFI